MKELRNSIEFKLAKYSGLLGVVFAILTDRKNVDAHFNGHITKLQSTHSNTRLFNILLLTAIVSLLISVGLAAIVNSIL